LQSTSIP